MKSDRIGAFYYAIISVLILSVIFGVSLESVKNEQEEIEVYKTEYSDVFRNDEALNYISIPEIKEENHVESDVITEEKHDYIYLGTFQLTAYCSCEKCCGKSDGITATGTFATQGRTIAVCPSQISYGTTVSIDGYGTYIAEDCGAAVTSNHIDIYFDSHQDALNFGVQYADVHIEV